MVSFLLFLRQKVGSCPPPWKIFALPCKKVCGRPCVYRALFLNPCAVEFFQLGLQILKCQRKCAKTAIFWSFFVTPTCATNFKNLNQCAASSKRLRTTDLQKRQIFFVQKSCQKRKLFVQLETLTKKTCFCFQCQTMKVKNEWQRYERAKLRSSVSLNYNSFPAKKMFSFFLFLLT